MKTVAFIGCGNMGGALVRAVARSLACENIFVFDLDPNKTEALQKELGVRPVLLDEAAQADLIVLGVKPQVLAQTLSSLRPTLEKRTGYTLLSMAAGTSIASIKEMAALSCPVIRIMPNTPASVGEGMILWTAEGTDGDTEDFFLKAFAKAGVLDRIDEKFIDAASALSGCGPAFVCLFAEALADGGVLCGLARDKANLYAAQTLLGTAKLLLESKTHPGALKDAVCSPGGTTIEGVRALEEGALRASVIDAVCAAYEKTLALGKK